MSIEPAKLTGAKVAFGNRVLWSGLDLIVEPGEFIAVLGPNGVGKKHPHGTAIATEPVAGYLLEDMKIKNITPDEFVEQSETCLLYTSDAADE